MSIQRYESCDVWEADEYEGRYVLHEDHVAAIAAAEARVADAIRDRILDYAAGLDGKATRSVALTCAGLATTAGLR